jgi:hypothetical protein
MNNFFSKSNLGWQADRKRVAHSCQRLAGHTQVKLNILKNFNTLFTGSIYRKN